METLNSEQNNHGLVWPEPPYFKFGPTAGKTPKETCFVHLNDGQELAGYLMRFSTEESRILFQPFTNNVSEIIPFKQIRDLQLLRPINLVRQQNFLEVRAQDIFELSEKQPYKIVFTNDITQTGETFGYVNTEAGLYIYQLTANEKVERHFIPRHAIKNYKIGMHIGEILIDENLATASEVKNALEFQHELRNKRIGDYLNENQILSAEQLRKAIAHQEQRPVLRLGEALIQLNLLTEEQLKEALEKQKQNRSLKLGEIIINMGIVDDNTLKSTLSKKLGIPFVNLSKFNFDLNAIKLVDKQLARKLTLMPLCIHEGTLVAAIEDPMDLKAIDELRFTTQMKVLAVMASHKDIMSALDENYGLHDPYSAGEANSFLANLDSPIEFNLNDSISSESGINALANKLFDEEKSSNMEVSSEQIPESDNTLVQLVNKMILDAFKDGVSDIHIETYPGKKNTQIRFRKDGSLTPYLQVPANFRNALISRLKIMAQLDISERRKPQDGKLDFQQFGPAKIELRVATIPTSNGLEDIVMRLLAASKPLPMEKLGLNPDAYNTIKKVTERPYGLILVCGPTGSGKTTTLHSLLGHINTPERKIWTAEDPIEISQAGLRQVQVNAKIGLTFAAAMRSFLRADPDVIMVGEMRDEETTRIGIEASLTGHLVLSTLHTNSAPESIVRMLDLGMDPFNFADALLAILAQRLAKSLCPKCKEAYEPTESELESLATEFVDNTDSDASVILAMWKQEQADHKLTLYKAKGCKSCNDTGYRGRIGLYELMEVTPEIKRMIQKRSPVSEITHQAMVGGMYTLKQDGILKVLNGSTDIKQVRAVCA
jgi:type II secretory ATPase GspE/PulE/Tfp pilus assembly ATPase PilB-like protein